MLENIWESLLWVIGGNEVEQVIPVWQLIVRTILIYGVAILIIRVGKRRFMGGFTTFDILLGFVVGSVLSRAITGAIRFVDMVVIVSVLAAVHWIFAIAGYYAGSFLSKKMKNSARKLVEDGQMIEEAMRKSKLGENDLMQAIRSKGNVDSIEKVKSAYLERDGNITVIPNGSEANIVEIDVKDNVQTVRIKIEHP